MIETKNDFEIIYKKKLDKFNQSDHYKLDIDELLSELSKLSFKSILDIGCGTGYLVKMLKNNYPKYTIKGIDKFSFGKSDHDVLDISNQNFKYNKKFDIIIMMHSINHISNVKIACNNLNNLLNHNGKIIIINPDRDFINIIDILHDSGLKEKTFGDTTVVKYLGVKEISDVFNLFNIKLISKKFFGSPMIIKRRDEGYKIYPRVLMIFEKD